MRNFLFVLSIASLVLTAEAHADRKPNTADGGCSSKSLSWVSESPGGTKLFFGEGKSQRAVKADWVNYEGAEHIWVAKDGSFVRWLRVKSTKDGIEENEREEANYAFGYDAKKKVYHSVMVDCE